MNREDESLRRTTPCIVDDYADQKSQLMGASQTDRAMDSKREEVEALRL